MDYTRVALEKHKEWRGKIETALRTNVDSADALSIAYTPGVAAPCLEIQKDVDKSYIYTRRWNTVAVVTDGTAILGLGDIGPEAGMPVMEGKCVLLKAFGDVDAVPLCIRAQRRACRKTSVFLSRETGISGNFVGRIKGAKCPFDLQFLTWDFS